MTGNALFRSLAEESVLWALETACREAARAFSRVIEPRSGPPPKDAFGVHAALEGLGFECTLVEGRIEPADPADLWFVALNEAADDGGAGPDTGSTAPVRLARLQRIDEAVVHLSDHRSPRGVAWSLGTYAERYAGYALRVRARQPTDGIGIDTEPSARGFGLHWFLREMRRYRAAWRDVLIASLCIQLLALIVPLLTQTVIDKVMTHRTANTLLVIAAAFLLVTLFSGLLAWLRQYFVLHAGTRIDAVLASDLFMHLLRLPLRYFEQRPTGVLVARLHAVETVREFMTGAAMTLLIDLPFMLLFAAIMFHYSPRLTAVAVGLLAAIVLVSVLGTPALRRAIDGQFLAGARQQAFVTERICGIETVKSLQLEPILEHRFEALYGQYLQAGLRTRLISAGIGIGAQSIEQALSLSVLCAGAWLVLEGDALSVGGLIAFQMFASRLTAPALRLAGLWQEFQQVHVAVRRMADIMDAPREPVRAPGARRAASAGLLQCEELGFRYRDGPWLFRGLSFELHPGECVAIVGPSGSGKSTFGRLLQGFSMPIEGRLRFDGVDSAVLAADEIRGYLGVVPQETRLFTGTILANLLDAAPGADFARIAAACRDAGIHDVIEALPEGYCSRIGENGVGLSGGQKQRLAIARALLKGARILIFDEPTSSLDQDLAHGLVDTINALRGRVSVVFIGHRVPQRLHCDRVVTVGQR